MVIAKHGEACPWDALLALEGRLTQVVADLAGLQHNHGSRCFLLRQMGSQLENKLARYAVPGLTPKQALHITFSRLSKGRVKRLNNAAFERVTAKYPGLEGGLEALTTLGTPIAHHEPARTSDGQQPVTSELLEDLINNEFENGDPVKSDVEEVLACLSYMAQELSEALFVSTV